MIRKQFLGTCVILSLCACAQIAGIEEPILGEIGGSGESGGNGGNGGIGSAMGGAGGSSVASGGNGGAGSAMGGAGGSSMTTGGAGGVGAAGGNGAGGAGGSMGCTSAADCLPTGSACIQRTCNGNTCETSNVPMGTACNENGGVVCNGAGTCVMATLEICLDGIDNDVDGAIDCADADCTVGFACETIPDGWSPAWTEQGMGSPPAAIPCGNGVMPETLFTGPAGPAECSNCTCQALTGTTCNAAQLLCFVSSQSCGTNQQDWTDSFTNGNCAKPNISLAMTLSCRLGNAASVNEPGSCVPSTSDFPNKDMWTGWVQSCAIDTSTAGCAASSVCVPKPTPTQSLCIRKDGQIMCPAGWTAVEAYAGGTDDRSCGACSCSANPTCTGGTYQVFDSNNCDANGGNPITVDSATCRNVSGQLDFGSWSIQKNPPTAGGSCSPQGGAPTGAVMPTGQVTFCCK